MYHLRLKGDYYQMGVKRGNIFQKAHISFPLQLDDFQLEHGKRSEEILRKFFPEICEEVRGVSDTIGTDYLHIVVFAAPSLVTILFIVTLKTLKMQETM